MAVCKILVRTSLLTVTPALRSTAASSSSTLRLSSHQASLFLSTATPRLAAQHKPSRHCVSISGAANPIEQDTESPDEDNVEHLLAHKDDVALMMKMDRRRPVQLARTGNSGRWFPYRDRFKCETGFLTSGEVLEATDSLIMDSRKEKFRAVVRNRSYSVCLVVEGLSDFGNVSATFRSADALGVQSVHVVACDSSKRYRENRHVSMGAEKWLDIELWDSIKDCYAALKLRGYHIATTHLKTDSVSVYDMDWSRPTAIVVGNESKGISKEALELSDMSCSIPMNGMVDSFNVSVAAGILMHQAVSHRNARLGGHGDLTSEESQILLAEFSLRHSRSSISIANEYVKRKAALLSPKL